MLKINDQVEEVMGTEGHLPANLSRFLKGLDFPAAQADLVSQAKENGADQGTLESLGKMPDKTYDIIADVMQVYRTLS